MIRRGRERPRSCIDHSRTISKLYQKDHSDPDDPVVCCLITIKLTSPEELEDLVEKVPL